MNPNDVLDNLTNEMTKLAEIEPPAGMWDRFAARLDAEEAEAPSPVRSTVRKQVFLRGLALVPTR